MTHRWAEGPVALRRYRFSADRWQDHADRLYWLLHGLMPDGWQAERTCHVTDAPALRLRATPESSGRWTTDVRLDLLSDLSWLPEAQVRVRAYHDLRTAEILAWNDQHGCPTVCARADRLGRSPDERMQQLRMLLVWLEQGRQQGRAVWSLGPRDAAVNGDPL